MDSRHELGEFLRSRRARLSPDDLQVPATDTARRVPGLRREEVALLAGVSVDYYIRLERGRTRGVSENVLEAVARALQLSTTERNHLFDLAKPELRRSAGRRLPPQKLRPGLRRLLELVNAPAVIQGRRMDVLAHNRLFGALYTDFAALPARERNVARFVFLDGRAESLFTEWEKAAIDTVASLRRYSARCPEDPQLAQLVGELSVHSAVFRRAWASHDVKVYTTGKKRFHHPLAGDLELTYESLVLPDDPDQTLVTYHADEGSRSQEGLDLLHSWSLQTTPRPSSFSSHPSTAERRARRSR